MAKSSDIETFKATKSPNGLDLTNSDLCRFDGRGYMVRNCDFSGSNMRGADFSNARFDDCQFDNCNWKSTSLKNAYFNGCSLHFIQNASSVRDFHTITAYGTETGFENYKSGFSERISWEFIKNVGQLPIFSVSSLALLLLPIFFYIIDIYNQHVMAWKNAIDLTSTELYIGNSFLERAVKGIPLIEVPALSFASLISAILLFFASLLYSFCCPKEIKEISQVIWHKQFKQSTIVYFSKSWRFPIVRIICASLYTIGGLIAIVVISCKLIYLSTYLYDHTKF